MKKTLTAFSYLFLILSLVFFSAGAYHLWLRNDPNRLAFSNYSAQERSLNRIETLPTRVTIERLSIDIPLVPAQLRGSQWETTERGASYLLSSPIPGETGNSVIYAHNWASLFGKLPTIASGDKITIRYADGSSKTFVVKNTSVVSPDDTFVLRETTEKQLTLYTCIGWFDTKRFVAIAVLNDKS